MADNTKEEYLDIPPSVPPENTPEEIIVVPVNATVPQNQSTETMEVHHHTM